MVIHDLTAALNKPVGLYWLSFGNVSAEERSQGAQEIESDFWPDPVSVMSSLKIWLSALSREHSNMVACRSCFQNGHGRWWMGKIIAVRRKNFHTSPFATCRQFPITRQRCLKTKFLSTVRMQFHSFVCSTNREACVMCRGIIMKQLNGDSGFR